MSFLTGAGAFAGGAAEGMDRGQLMLQRAQQIKAGQAALDQAKMELAANAAAFAGLDGGGPTGGGAAMSLSPGLPGPQGGVAPPGQMAQPMMPGQPSVAARQPAVPPQTGFSPAPGPSSPGGPPSPAPQQGAGGFSAPAGQPGQSGQQGEIDPTDPRAAVQTVLSVAREIKSRNPNIDPQTLMLATSRIIDMSKGLAPALRQGAQVVVQQLRNEGAMGRTTAQVKGRQKVAETQAGSRERAADQRDVTTRRGQDISLQRVQLQGAQALERARLLADAANERAATGAWSREKQTAFRERMGAATAKLRTAQQQLSSLQSSLVPATDPRATAAVAAQDQAIAEMDRVIAASNVGTTPPPAAGGAAPRAPAAPGSRQAPAERAARAASRGPAPASLKGKPIWPEGGKWVFEDGTEAK